MQKTVLGHIQDTRSHHRWSMYPKLRSDSQYFNIRFELTGISPQSIDFGGDLSKSLVDFLLEPRRDNLLASTVHSSFFFNKKHQNRAVKLMDKSKQTNKQTNQANTTQVIEHVRKFITCWCYFAYIAQKPAVTIRNHGSPLPRGIQIFWGHSGQIPIQIQSPGYNSN